jgi:iron complex transport system ATP-binding protein
MVTHQIESIVEEIERVIFLKDGILIGDGAPKNQLKSDLLSGLFETPLEVIHINGYWQILPGDISSI